MSGAPSVGPVNESDDEALWRGVLHTLVNTVVPALDDAWARTAAVQLAGLAEARLARAATHRPSSIHDPALVQRDTELIAAYRGGAPNVSGAALPAGSSKWCAALDAWLRGRGEPGSVRLVTRIATGNSRGMWHIAREGAGALVLRIEQGGVFATSGTAEAALMIDLAAVGVPVATVRAVEPTGSVLGHPFFVMDFVESASAAGEDRSLPDAVAADYVRCLHHLHQVAPPSRLGTTTARAATLAEIDRWLTIAKGAVSDIGSLAHGADWLREHATQFVSDGAAVVVHGDPGPGNFLHDGARTLVFTDWEFAHLGDANEDWAYVIAMRGARTMSPAAWGELIAEAGAALPSPEVLRYWSAYNFFKGACANLTCLGAFAGDNPAPNMAIIGTALQRRFQRSMDDLIA